MFPIILQVYPFLVPCVNCFSVISPLGDCMSLRCFSKSVKHQRYYHDIKWEMQYFCKVQVGSLKTTCYSFQDGTSCSQESETGLESYWRATLAKPIKRFHYLYCFLKRSILSVVMWIRGTILSHPSYLLILGCPYRAVIHLSDSRLLGTIGAVSHFYVQSRNKRRRRAILTYIIWHRLPGTMPRCNSLLSLHWPHLVWCEFSWLGDCISPPSYSLVEEKHMFLIPGKQLFCNKLSIFHLQCSIYTFINISSGFKVFQKSASMNSIFCPYLSLRKIGWTRIVEHLILTDTGRLL